MEAAVEHALFSRDTFEAALPIIRRTYPTAAVDVDGFDCYVHIPGNVNVTIGDLFKIARGLRGGKNFDPNVPADWHVRSLGPSPRNRDDGAPRPEPSPTTIWFCRTYQAPPGYREFGHPEEQLREAA